MNSTTGTIQPEIDNNLENVSKSRMLDFINGTESDVEEPEDDIRYKVATDNPSNSTEESNFNLTIGIVLYIQIEIHKYY